MLEKLHAHREWANQLFIEWYLGLPQPEEYCLKMLSHILLAEEVWLLRLQAKPTREVWQPLPVGELKSLSEANNAEWRKVLKMDLSRNFRFRRFSGEESESNLGDIAIHVCTHGVYHRGQIAAQAARVGLKCPPTDFIVFSRLGWQP